jgi:lycopene beta-cyclase
MNTPHSGGIPAKNVLNNNYDIIIIGAGLAGLSLAYRLKNQQPNIRLLILDETLKLTADKTWSFHSEDIKDLAPWRDFISYSWPQYQVEFSYLRTIDKSYYTISSQHFFSKMTDFLGADLRLGKKVVQVQVNRVVTDAGEIFSAPIVIDARLSLNFSLTKAKDHAWGYQKFLGLELKMQEKHGLQNPILMDATVDQKDGYRFMYVLPYSEDQLLIEDTHYSNSPELNVKEYTEEILNYAKSKGWNVSSQLRSEIGVLPIPTTRWVADLAEKSAVLKIGSGAGFYHPVTGYSFLWCVRVANALAEIKNPSRETYSAALLKLQKELNRNTSFYLMLNKLLFYGADTSNRKNIFQRFYKLPESTIGRFYASKTSLADKFRIMIGRPPISVASAWKALLKKRCEQ